MIEDLINNIPGMGIKNRLKNIQYLGNVKSADGIRQLIKCLDDGNVKIRRAASCSLEQHWMTGDVDAIVALTKALDDADAEVRKNAAFGLGEFVSRSVSTKECDAAKRGMIVLLARESDEGVIKCAVVGLAHIQDEALIGPMAEAFKGKDKKSIAMSIDAIGDLLPTRARLEMKRALRAIL